MLFFSFFKTLVDQEVTVELKNDVAIRGVLKSVDQYLNIKLDDIQVVEELKYPHLVRTMRLSTTQKSSSNLKSLANIRTWLSLQSSVRNIFIRGSVVRYVHLPATAVDTALLEDATRRGSSPGAPGHTLRLPLGAASGPVPLTITFLQKPCSSRQKRSEATKDLLVLLG
ncbi:MAG: U6 snRNA-associated Sm-like protein LSm2 [Lichina confinis]|nr:MAG: U6 snRNA-associated Sm-like protein LSm2 [Lichina confinis]